MSTILYLDKEYNNLHSFHAYFRRKIEYDYFMCSTEEDALSLIISENIQVLICDQSNQETTGIEFLQGIATSLVPPILISVSGQRDLSILEEALNQRKISCYLSKPLDYEALYLILQKLLNQTDLSSK